VETDNTLNYFQLSETKLHFLRFYSRIALSYEQTQRNPRGISFVEFWSVAV